MVSRGGVGNKSFSIPPDALSYYIDHPVAYIEDMILQLNGDEIKHQRPGRRVEPEQQCILNALAGHRTVIGGNGEVKEVQEYYYYENPPYDGGKHVSARSGHGIGKTTAIAFAMFWFMGTRRNAQIMLTGSKFDQLKITTWAEFAKWHSKGNSEITSYIDVQSESAHHIEAPLSWFIKIVTSGAQENITGFHEDHVLIVVDEASAESIDRIMDGLMGCVTKPDNHLLMLGNPTRTLGAFYDTHHRDKDIWITYHFDSEKSKMVDKTWLSSMANKYHKDSDIYAVRVKGEFPKGNPKSIISYEECENARKRDVLMGDFLEFGVDPAHEGNDLFTIAVRSGNKMIDLRKWPRVNDPEMIRNTLDTVRYWRRKTGIKSIAKIKIDAGGGYGNGLIDTLTLNTTDNLDVYRINSNARSDRPDEYKNFGTQMWYDMADIINEIEIIDDDFLIEELSGRERNEVNLSTVAVEPKTVFKKRINRSPDLADATILCFVTPKKKVFEQSSEGEEKITEFRVDWLRECIVDPNYVGPIMYNILHCASMTINNDLTINSLGAIYEFYRDLLWIYAEYYCNVPDMEIVAPHIKKIYKLDNFKDERNCKLIVSDKMTHRNGDKRPIVEVVRRHNVYPVSAMHYDEYGAISLGSQMFRSGRIIMNNNLHRARSQINLWSTDKTKINDDEYGYCKCLLLILSDIKKEIESKPALPEGRYKSPISGKYNDYKKIKTEQENELSGREWMGR